MTSKALTLLFFALSMLSSIMQQLNPPPSPPAPAPASPSTGAKTAKKPLYQTRATNQILPKPKYQGVPSVGNGIGHYSLSSPQDAREVALYLYQNFLSGKTGPLGNVALDGVDFDIVEGSNPFYNDLLRAINAFSTQEKIVYLSAAPQCPYPDHYLDKAIKTGLFDYIWVQFYDNPPCQYSNGNPKKLFEYWDMWTSSVLANNTVLLRHRAAESGLCFAADTMMFKQTSVIRLRVA
ncbi:hypothetical protein PIB30_009685 [Stylosanthes scabra]|uniref:GH18 domain-containing protein n=1 Tax=Stylosanthes scabra TaxID=79078 RepID=A0ABU6V8D8_9FABA|nr:hypothetical protein [Stylosanthes scabra]